MPNLSFLKFCFIVFLLFICVIYENNHTTYVCGKIENNQCVGWKRRYN